MIDALHFKKESIQMIASGIAYGKQIRKGSG